MGSSVAATGRDNWPQSEPTEVRLWAVSDIHTDLRENAAWISGLSATEYRHDALIVAGDVSDHLAVLEQTLRILSAKFKVVFFTPGNHDLWVTMEDKEVGVADSLAKLRRILELCASLGVYTEPQRFGTGGNAVWVCPLLSWHHQSFDTEPDLQGWHVPKVDKAMNDYKYCSFPGLSMHDDSAARHVDSLNDHRLTALGERGVAEPLVSFSHFLPRLELLPEKRFLSLPVLPKAVGSTFLRSRVEALQPAVHVFGHTHLAWDAVHDGVRYIQAALSYPEERLSRWASLQNGDFGRKGPLLIWSSASGLSAKRSCRWSGYYEHRQREPHRVFELATYAAGHFAKVDERAVTCTPDFSFLDVQPVLGRLDADPAAPLRSR